MHSYLDLVREYSRIHKKKNMVILACVALAVCLVTAIFSMADIGLKFEMEQLKQEYGNYHIQISDVSEEVEAAIANRFDVAYSGKFGQIPSTTYEGKSIRFMGSDQEIAEQFGTSIKEGRYPKAPNEIIVDQQAITQFGWAIGNDVTINLEQAGLQHFTVVGIYDDMTMLTSRDEHGIMLSMEGILKLSSSYQDNYWERFVVTFQDGTNIKKSIDQIKKDWNFSDDQVDINKYLLLVIGQSEENLAIKLYTIATTLFILVLASSSIMISNSFNMSIVERVKFFGLMRCLGASKKQVRRYVLYEGLQITLKGIPMGLILGFMMEEFSILLLQIVNPSFFGEIKVVQISIIGIISGIVVGFVTVIISALSPAKKASSISPLAAILGNTSIRNKVTGKKAVRINKMPIEISMGTHHAFSNKKSFVLMLASFIISITMFLGFQVLIDFGHNAFKPLSPSTPDFSIYDPNVSELVEKDTLEDIKTIQGIEHVFGRRLNLIPAFYPNNKSGNSYMISYDELQFKWAKDTLADGHINHEKLNSGDEVLVDVESNLSVGDTITFQGVNGDYKTRVGGILSSIPFDSSEQVLGKVIVSDQLFINLTGIEDYTILDIQIDANAPDEISTILRQYISGALILSDLRAGNMQARSAFYTMAIFVYGFVIIIAIITLFNIINSMNISVMSRTNYYGMMRAVGTSVKQLNRMVITEAATYAFLGSLIGSITGFAFHKLAFEMLVTPQFHISWEPPFKLIIAIVITAIIITILSVIYPLKKISKLDIVTIINTQ